MKRSLKRISAGFFGGGGYIDESILTGSSLLFVSSAGLGNV